MYVEFVRGAWVYSIPTSPRPDPGGPDMVICMEGHKYVVRSWNPDGSPNVYSQLDSSNAPEICQLHATRVRQA